mmetsp:Transcript_6586/g.9383  ORF Transcript_6586/g.9383 Transcript_6586/m.9383 type:complete len:184 (-) Transcript_6586:160-711(-)|eukprot:CAMPEP_0194763132 /NCGR_PEP_ID=MMETSP0323_2-20130528/18142_1 /TAXON_ID=2866 ORGANISM="Crypthecodinium cohnii, Strain Seligo" /NCGR_SAMPLE_ID=MMETSP0323_2 /ASSEMBLY_ACC=CAM_ASM_000346 /LENGTH=183 /DNA_ID=CAMNT_0039687205 /DNA_START=52 /DNA_END=603 /DNA_ORIENTATION=+
MALTTPVRWPLLATTICLLSQMVFATDTKLLALDDECAGPEDCSVDLMQLRGIKSHSTDCPANALVGHWIDKDALGYKTINIELDVKAPMTSDCSKGVKADIIMPSYLGPPVHYDVTLTPLENGKFHVKYYNAQAAIPYYHEGEFDPSTNMLTEDLGHMNGQVNPDGTLEHGKVLYFEKQHPV